VQISTANVGNGSDSSGSIVTPRTAGIGAKASSDIGRNYNLSLSLFSLLAALPRMHSEQGGPSRKRHHRRDHLDGLLHQCVDDPGILRRASWGVGHGALGNWLEGRRRAAHDGRCNHPKPHPRVLDPAQAPMNFATSFGLLLLGVFLLPVLISGCLPCGRDGVPWYEARRDPTGLAPDPGNTPEAVIQVYAARAVSWRGVFSVHTWIAVKPTGVPRYTRYEVLGFGVANGAPAVRIDRTGPDNYWFGARPQIILDRRGPGVDALIEEIHAAVADYPYPHEYRAWPGPNSNTFTAYIARRVPGLGLDLPSNAVGKDFLPGGALFARTPSGSGFQFSLYGLAGALLAVDERFELNVLRLNIGVDAGVPALKLPAIGRLGLDR